MQQETEAWNTKSVDMNIKGDCTLLTSCPNFMAHQSRTDTLKSFCEMKICLKMLTYMCIWPGIWTWKRSYSKSIPAKFNVKKLEGIWRMGWALEQAPWRLQRCWFKKLKRKRSWATCSSIKISPAFSRRLGYRSREVPSNSNYSAIPGSFLTMWVYVLSLQTRFSVNFRTDAFLIKS